MFTGKCRHDSERLEELASALNPASPTTEVKQPTSASDRSAQTGSISGAGPRAKNASQSDLFAQLLRSSGAPPLDVSEFFGIPAAAAAAPESTPEVSMPPQSKARAGGQSDLLAQLLSSLGKFLILKPF